jgi:hypothetical protein
VVVVELLPLNFVVVIWYYYIYINIYFIINKNLICF